MCVYLRPHGVGDTHRGTEEGGETEEGDEDGGHLADSVWPPGGLTVHHHAALWREKQHRLGSEVTVSITTVRKQIRHPLSFYCKTTVFKGTNQLSCSRHKVKWRK